MQTAQIGKKWAKTNDDSLIIVELGATAIFYLGTIKVFELT